MNDLELLIKPNKNTWKDYPYMSMKKGDKNGFVLAGKPTVYLHGILSLVLFDFDRMAKTEYTSFVAMLDDGWKCDL
jgi:hypothetical protein